MIFKKRWNAITSIDRKIRFLSISILVASILLCTTANITISYYNNNRNVTQYNTALLAQISNNIDSYFSTMNHLIYGFACNTESQTYLNACYKAKSAPSTQKRKYLENLLVLLSNTLPDCTLHLFIENDNFSPIHIPDVTKTPTAFYNYKSDKWYEKFSALPEKQMTLLLPSSEQNYYPEAEPEGITVVYRLRNNQTLETIAYLLVDIPSHVINSLVKIESGTNFYLCITDSDEFTVYNSKPQTGSQNYLTLTLTNPKTGWDLTAYTQNSYYYYNFIFILLSSIFSAFVIGIVVVFLSVHFAKSLTVPLRLLTNAMEEMETGTFGKKIDCDTNDEIGYLIERFNNMNQKIEELTQKNESIQLAERNAHIAALQNQINPHFLYNTLEMIKGIADGPSASIIKNCCNSLSNMFRYNLKGPYRVSLSQELDHIRYYLYIMQYRFENLFTTEYIIDETLLQYKCIKFLLQPFVENAIIHGFADYQRHGILSIQITRADSGHIQIQIRDNGQGMDASTLAALQAKLDIKKAVELPDEENIGIANTHRRLLLNYEEQYHIHIESELDVGTAVTVIIPKTF